MSDVTSKSINTVLRTSGIPSSELTTTSCQQTGPCEIEFRKDPKDKSTEKLTFQDIGELFEFVNQWLIKNPNAAKAKTSNSSPLFRPLTSEWALIDWNKTPGYDALLYRSDNQGWKVLQGKNSPEKVDSERLKRLLERAKAAGYGDKIKEILAGSNPGVTLIEFLSKLTWKDLGLKIDSKNFEKTVPGIKVDTQSAAHEIIGPWHRVTLDGNPDITVPWSDNYLRNSWFNLLAQNGLKYFSFQSENIFYFEGLSLIQLIHKGSVLEIRLLGPLGQIEQKTNVSIKSPEIVFDYPESSPEHGSLVEMKTQGEKIQVDASFSKGIPYSERLNRLRILARALSMIPSGLLRPMLSKKDKESPLTIKYTEPTNSIIRGDYDRYENSTDLPQETGIAPGYFLTKKVFHEIGGHAFSDFSVSKDNPAGITHPRESVIREYFAWKLLQIFTVQELKVYVDTSNEYSLAQKGVLSRDLDVVEKSLSPFRSKATASFVSVYAVEGSEGLPDASSDPTEYFAESMRDFLQRYNDLQKAQEPIKDPFLKMLGMEYFFRQYQVAKIGKLEHHELFSKKGFQEVLGIDLNQFDYKTAGKAGLLVSPYKPPAEEATPENPKENKEKPKSPQPTKNKKDNSSSRELRESGFSLPLYAGAQFSDFPGDRKGKGVFFALKPGFQGKHFGAGGLLGFNQTWFSETYQPLTAAISLDVGGYGQWLQDLGPITFFLEPSMGYRHTSFSQKNQASETQNLFWLGAGAGVGAAGFSLMSHYKLGVSGNGPSNEFGIGLIMDFPSLFRFVSRP